MNSAHKNDLLLLWIELLICFKKKLNSWVIRIFHVLMLINFSHINKSLSLLLD